MSRDSIDMERLLREAMAPIDPPERLVERVQVTLLNLSEMAADELESWELAAMRDPRNWVRPAAAVAVGGLAGAGLAVLGWRQQSRSRGRRTGGVLDRTAQDVSGAVRRRLGHR